MKKREIDERKSAGWLPFVLFLFNSAKQFNQNVWLIAAEWRKERKNGPAPATQQSTFNRFHEIELNWLISWLPRSLCWIQRIQTPLTHQWNSNTFNSNQIKLKLIWWNWIVGLFPWAAKLFNSLLFFELPIRKSNSLRKEGIDWAAAIKLIELISFTNQKQFHYFLFVEEIN